MIARHSELAGLDFPAVLGRVSSGMEIPMMSSDGLKHGEAARVVCESADPIFSPLTTHARHPPRRRAIGQRGHDASRPQWITNSVRLTQSAARALRDEPKPLAELGRAVRARQALVLQHTSLVKQIAFQFIRRMPDHVEVDELIQAGMVGLLEAASRYTAGELATFKTYASPRIRGAILDSVRKSDWTPRSVYRRLRDIENTKRRLQNEASKITTSADVASALGISLKDYHGTLQHAAMSRLVSLDGLDSADEEVLGGNADPADEVEQKNLRRMVTAAIDALPEKERVVLLLHYDAGLVFREIGEQFDLTESRICQLHKRAIERLRKVAQSWMQAAGARILDRCFVADEQRSSPLKDR